MIEAWQSGRFRTYPTLPGWTGPAWSLLLVPDWRALIGRPLPDIVAAQWKAAIDTMLDDFGTISAQRIHVVRYDDMLANPQHEMRRLCDELGLTWDRPIDKALPLSRFTVSEPAAEKWRRHEALIDAVLPHLEATLDRLERFIAR